MNKLILMVLICSVTFLCFADGYTPSKLDEVIDEFEGIFIVKIINIEQETIPTEQGGISTYVHATFQVKEILKGTSQNINKATYILPSFYRFFVNNNGKKTRFSEWLKIRGSGIETELEKNKNYIIYFTKYGLNPNNGNFRFDRADNIDKKNQVVELLRKSNQ